jgi:hypothetical protein
MSDVRQASGITSKFSAIRIVIMLAPLFLALMLITEVLELLSTLLVVAAIIGGLASILLAIDLIHIIIFYSIWIYAFHKELKEIDSSYDVQPGQALARLLIPGYNIWGIWKIHSMYARWLRSDLDQNRMAQGSRMMQILRLCYISLIGGYILGRFANIKGIGNELSGLLDILGSLMYVAEFILWLQMIKIMQGTIVEKINQK